MKLSLNWIKKYVDLPDVTMAKLAYDLTMCTVEVEDIASLSENLSGLVVGKIITVEPHPNAGKLHLCTVDTGDPVPSMIVCGGVNLAPSMLVAVAKPGAAVRWHGKGDPVKIKPLKLRGMTSFGMICASNEIGLGDLFPAEHTVIMDVTEFGAAPGTPLAVALGLDDAIIDIDNKSITNRPDLWGHYGMARELSAIYKCKLKPIKSIQLPSVSGGLGVVIDNPEHCARYAGAVIKNVRNIESPFELRSLLWRVGMRPINLPVDITNYIMLATGQPIHAFDRSHISGDIHVRMAKEGETLELLDGKVLKLTKQDLVIADGKAPVALAGIMGGKLDSILPETTELILEAANFDALSVRRTSQHFDVRTEASTRFEKSIDPQRVDSAMAASVAMFKQYFPDAEVTGYTESYPRPLAKVKVEVSMAFLKKRLGRRSLSPEEVKGTLAYLGFNTKTQGDKLLVEVPTWRSTGDISLPDDILEEIARLMGYENFDYVAPTVILEKAVNQRVFDTERAVREYLAFRCGMQEVFTYPWIENKYIEASGANKSLMLSLSTPPAPDECHLRSTLVPGLLKAVFTNLRYFDTFKLFELTQVFFNRNFAKVSNTSEYLPEMNRSLGAAFVGGDARALFREAKGVLEYMHRVVQIEQLRFSQDVKPMWADDKLWLNIICNSEVLGELGLVSPKSAKAAGIKRGLAVLFELNVEKLVPLASRQNTFTHLPAYPLVDFDLSVLFDESLKWVNIEETVSKTAMVRQVKFIGEYRGPQVADGKKSITFRTWIGSDEGTLSSEQIDAIIKQVTKKLTKKFGGDVRGE